MPTNFMNPVTGAVPMPQDPTQPKEGDIDPQTGMPYTSAQIAAMLGTYGDTLDLENLTSQQDLADALRGSQVPEGRSGGRVYTAANPLEVLGTIGQQYAGKRMNDKIEKKGGKLRGKIGENVATYGKGLFGKTLAGDGVPSYLKKPDEELGLRIPDAGY